MKKRLISLCFVLTWMYIIFSFSNQTGSSSQGMSLGILHTFLGQFNLSLELIDLLHYLLRKCAHVGSYFILSLLTYYHLTSYEIKAKFRYLLTFLISVLYACSDEIHQTFIPNRLGSMSDVFIDSIGILLALLLIYFIKKRLIQSQNNLK